MARTGDPGEWRDGDGGTRAGRTGRIVLIWLAHGFWMCGLCCDGELCVCVRAGMETGMAILRGTGDKTSEG